MIKEEDLQEAIAECQGIRNPNANTCLKLASYYTILDHTKEKEEEPAYSYAPAPDRDVDFSFSDSEFAQMVNGRPAEDMWKLMDELMSTLQVINPRLYKGVMRKIED